LLVYAIVPIGHALSLRGLVVDGRSAEANTDTRERVVLLWLVGFSLLVEVATYLSWGRLLFVSMPAIILLVWAWEREGGRRRASVERIVWAGAALLAVVLVRSAWRHHRLVVDLPAGSVATDDAFGQELRWLALHTRPDDLVFVADRPSLYLPLRLHNPLFLDAAVPTPQTTIAMAQRAIAGLDDSRVPYVVWSGVLEAAAAQPSFEGMTALAGYLHQHYRRVETFKDGDEVWARN
jgi:hypothetical protein